MFASSVGGWLTAGLFSGVYSASVAGTVAGMLLRLFLPLGALAWLGSVDPALIERVWCRSLARAALHGHVAHLHTVTRKNAPQSG